MYPLEDLSLVGHHAREVYFSSLQAKRYESLIRKEETVLKKREQKGSKPLSSNLGPYKFAFMYYYKSFFVGLSEIARFFSEIKKDESFLKKLEKIGAGEVELRRLRALRTKLLKFDGKASSGLDDKKTNYELMDGYVKYFFGSTKVDWYLVLDEVIEHIKYLKDKRAEDSSLLFSVELATVKALIPKD